MTEPIRTMGRVARRLVQRCFGGIVRAGRQPAAASSRDAPLGEARDVSSGKWDRRKRHVAVIGHYAGSAFFGAERSLLGILAAIDPRKYDVSCVLPRASDTYLEAVSRYTKNITVLSYKWWSGSRPLNEQALADFESLFQRAGVDVVHVNTITVMEPLRAARRLGIPAAVHVRELIDQDEQLAGHFGLKPSHIVETVREAADFIIANSDATLRLYQTDERRSFRLYNSIDAECFDLPCTSEPGKLRVGMISNNLPKKGVKEFIQLAIAANASRPDLQFLLIGPHSEYTDQLEQMRKVEAVPANLRLLGYVATPAEAMQQVDVVLSLSNFAESFGRTIAEAMAAGRPVIAYERGAAAELIRDGIDGHVIPPFDYDRALPLLAELADHPERRLEMGKNGRERAQCLFSPEVFATNLDGIYRQIFERWNDTAGGLGTSDARARRRTAKRHPLIAPRWPSKTSALQ